MSKVPLRSMTGFGEAELDDPAGRLRAEIRTVNHRYLNLQIRTPSGFDRHQPHIEEALRRWFRRGHISVNIGLERPTDDPVVEVEVDLERARGYQEALGRIRTRLGVEGDVELSMLSGFSDIFRLVEVEREEVDVDPDSVVRVIDRAASEARAMRETEGARLKSELTSRLDAMAEIVERIAARAPHRLVEERDRLRSAIGELLEGQGEVDEERIAREVAHMADRWDIHEEIVRFRSHLALFRETLEEGSDDGVGKRFGFISQEILREANTMGSKANDAEIARQVVLLKGEIERLREQLENVE